MNAILYRSYGPPEVLELGSLPDPVPGPGQVLVRIRAAALNPVDAEVRRGRFRPLPGQRLPKVPGCDFAGTVVALGAGTSGFQPGDAVYGMSYTWKGGALAGLIAISASQIAHKPVNLTFDEAAGIPLAGLTALQALHDLGHALPGKRVLIHGASGGVGVFAVQIARTYGMHVVATSSSANLELTRMLGAHESVDYRAQRIETLPGGFDICFDVYGNLSWPLMRPLLKPGGVYVTTIPSVRNFVHQVLSWFTRRRARVVLVQPLHADLSELRALAENLDLKPVIDHVYPLAQAREAFARLESRRARGKVVLEIPEPAADQG